MSRPISSESVFRAVAHPTRRRILQLLRRRAWLAGDLAAQFRHSHPVLSRHLRILDAAGLVRCDRRGAYRQYRLAPKRLAVIRAWLGSVDRSPTPAPHREA